MELATEEGRRINKAEIFHARRAIRAFYPAARARAFDLAKKTKLFSIHYHYQIIHKIENDPKKKAWKLRGACVGVGAFLRPSN